MMNKESPSPPVRAPRVSYFGKSPALFVSCPALGADAIEIGNISTSGARLLATDLLKVVVGREYKCLLHFRNHFLCGTKMKVIHTENNSAGVEFIAPTNRLRCLIRAYLKTELVGASLHRDVANKSRWVSDTGNDEMELGFESGQLGFISLSLDSIGCRWQWPNDPRNLKGNLSEETLLRVLRNIPKISYEKRAIIESTILSHSFEES